ncbi:MAG: hypothetical protein HFJ04_08360 [Lachnospiraceae bacterium]|nr:hypothetical protein [Lachnospiraceae bacterium]
MLRRLNKALPELVLAILIYGVFAQCIGIWMAEDKLLYSTGLWIGVILAIGMAIHMAVVIEDAVSIGSSQGKLIAMSLIRYIVVVLVFLCIIYFHLGSPIAAFVGVMGLKIAAYMQPFLHKVIIKRQGRGEYSKESGMEE